MKKVIPFLISLLLLAALLWFIFFKDRGPGYDVMVAPGPKETLPPAPEIGLQHPPRGFKADWSKLDAYQGTISADELRTAIEDVYAVGDTWQEVIEIEPEQATIKTTENETYILKLRTGDAPDDQEIERYWSTGPLDSLHIAIDAGHIGGKFGNVEGREFGNIGDRAVREGSMALITAKRLKPLLEAMGAQVTLVRDKNEPVTQKRTEYYLDRYKELNPEWPDALLKPWAEKRFYRRAEIVDRARLVNEEIQPDMVLCLHYNASGGSGNWTSPTEPYFSEENHLHILVNGAYTKGEVLDEGDRFQMLERILQRIHTREAELGKVMADVFAEQTGLPPYSYAPNSSRAKNVDGHPYLWARNLLANRSYTCPVIFFEPWVMNNADVYARAQAGDYDGVRTINGKSRPSIMAEYAEAVAAGLAKFYSQETE